MGESVFSGFGPPFRFVCLGYSQAVCEEHARVLSHVRLL